MNNEETKEIKLTTFQRLLCGISTNVKKDFQELSQEKRIDLFKHAVSKIQDSLDERLIDILDNALYYISNITTKEKNIINYWNENRSGDDPYLRKPIDQKLNQL